MQLTEADIYAIQRPHPRLLWLYFIRAAMTLPLFPVTMLLLFFRYETLRYQFDAEGIHMRWGILFRREINLTYARIQDIHLTSGLIQRWFGLADLKIQTAAGTVGAEMTIEGLLESEAIRDFLYTRMRGYREAMHRPPVAAEPHAPAAAAGPAIAPPGDPQALALLGQAVAELRAARAALEKLAGERRDV